VEEESESWWFKGDWKDERRLCLCGWWFVIGEWNLDEGYVCLA
jgi:hypothetical protein